MISSKFNLISVGIVAEDKPLDTNLIKVYPIELLPMFSGELEPVDTDIESSGKNDSGDLYTVKVEVSNYIEAIWLNETSNRISSPDVVKGEQILIYNYADSNEYYWVSMGRDQKLRKLETVTYAFSDIPENTGDIKKGRDNQYLIEVSTHGKHITLTTCKGDNEPFKYLMQFNTKNGSFILRDDADNKIYLDSKNTEIKLENKEKTHVFIDKKDISIYAPDNITINAENDINVISGNDLNIRVGSNATIDVGENVKYSSGGSYSLTVGNSYSVDSSSTVTIKSASGASVEAPVITLAGTVGMGIGMAMANKKNSSSATVYGSMEITDSIKVTNSITAKTINSNTIEAKEMTADKFTGNFYGTLYGSTVP